MSTVRRIAVQRVAPTSNAEDILAQAELDAQPDGMRKAGTGWTLMTIGAGVDAFAGHAHRSGATAHTAEHGGVEQERHQNVREDGRLNQVPGASRKV
jgi:hypothetical protein